MGVSGCDLQCQPGPKMPMPQLQRYRAYNGLTGKPVREFMALGPISALVAAKACEVPVPMVEPIKYDQNGKEHPARPLVYAASPANLNWG